MALPPPPTPGAPSSPEQGRNRARQKQAAERHARPRTVRLSPTAAVIAGSFVVAAMPAWLATPNPITAFRMAHASRAGGVPAPVATEGEAPALIAAAGEDGGSPAKAARSAGQPARERSGGPPAAQPAGQPAAAPAQGVPDPNLGQQLAADGNPNGATACSGCHGMNGSAEQGAGSFPRLADQDAHYLYKQLNDYASGARPNEIMGPIAQALSDAERQATAAYFAAQRGVPYPAPGAVDEAARKGAETLVFVGSNDRRVQACTNCHGPAAVGQAPLYPRLAGQYADYAQAQLQAFRGKGRHNDVGAVMREIAGKLTDAEIAAVSAYLAALRPATP